MLEVSGAAKKRISEQRGQIRQHREHKLAQLERRSRQILDVSTAKKKNELSSLSQVRCSRDGSADKEQCKYRGLAGRDVRAT